MKVTVQIEIPDSRVADLLEAGFDGGASYWIGEATLVAPEGPIFDDGVTGGRSKLVAYPLSEGGRVEIVTVDDVEDLEEGVTPEKKFINRDLIHYALGIMSTRYPRHFATFMAENEDAETGDVLLQLAALGEIVYG